MTPVKDGRYVRSFASRRYVVEWKPRLNAWAWWSFEVDPYSRIDLRKVRSEIGVFQDSSFERVLEHADDEIAYQQTLRRHENLDVKPTQWRKAAGGVQRLLAF
jgi:hypothetical protein